MSETQTSPVIREIPTNHTYAKIFDALAKAQGEFPVIPKDSIVEVKNKEGRFLYSYKYADLTTIISATRPALSKNGLSFTQGACQGGFVTSIAHSSGEQIATGFIPCEIPKNADMKTVAGIITYVKRISLTAALGVSADEDVDAAPTEANHGNSTDKKSLSKSNQASAPKPQAQKTPPPSAPAKNYAPGADLPPDEYAQAPSEDLEGMTLLDELHAIVDERAIPPAEVKKIITIVAGPCKNSKKLNDAELLKVIQMLKLSKPG